MSNDATPSDASDAIERTRVRVPMTPRQDGFVNSGGPPPATP
jgi:hypothetical protein